MVQAQELRMGNLLKANGIHGGEIKRFKYLHEDLNIAFFIDETVAGEYLSDCSPIPLTPEILEKAGFEWYRPLNHWRLVEGEQWYSVKNVLFDEPKAELLCFSWCNLSWDEASSMPPKVVNYVHQLQNLYFALAGQELEINL